jgi:formylglycine-generating enzyme required for sulfatase activity
LPTEIEWEYVARAGARTSRFYGNAESDLVKYAWCAVNSKNRTWPVGRKRPNPLGFFDIYGNIDEWCEVWPTVDPSWPGATRGGGFRATAKFLRSAMPHEEQRTTVFSFYGFRIAMTLQGP